MKTYLRKALYKLLTSLMDRDKLLFLLSNKQEKELLGFLQGGYLYDVGWINSIITNTITDVNGNPLPWVTYPFIHFIQNRLQPQFEIFEYGSGNSTLYYSKKVAHVDSVENDLQWFEKIKGEMPGNVNLFYCEVAPGGDYCKYVQHAQKHYDIVIIDGRDRANCCKQCTNALKPGGIVVLDDSERAEYIPGIEFLTGKGFKRIDFWGMAPTVNYLKCTTIFYKSGNCLNI